MKVFYTLALSLILSLVSSPSFSGDAEITLKNRAGFEVEREMKESGEKGGTADLNIGVGELQECTGSENKGVRCKGKVKPVAAQKPAIGKPAPTKAQDYNSSRSNNESSSTRAIDYNSSRSNNDGVAAPAGGGKNCKPKRGGDGLDNDCDGAAAPSPANHNSTRSNR